MFTDTVDSYNQQDQINSRTLNRRDANDDGTLANAIATAYGYTYDPGRGDALTNVSVGVDVNTTPNADSGRAPNSLVVHVHNLTLGIDMLYVAVPVTGGRRDLLTQGCGPVS